MTSINMNDSESPSLPPRQEHRMHVEADDHTDEGRVGNSEDDIATKNDFFKQRARSISSALKDGRYGRARRLAVNLQKYEDIPLECTVTCFWALARESQHTGELLLAQEYLEMYILCITDLIKIDANQNLPLDESKLTLKTLGQQSLDQVNTEIQAEIKAGEAIEHDTESSDGILYMKGKTEEMDEEGEKATEVKGGRKRRNAQGGEAVSPMQLAAERKALFKHAAMSPSAQQEVFEPKALNDGWVMDDIPQPSHYESLITGDAEHAVEDDNEDDFAHEADLDGGLMFPRTWSV